MSLETAFQIVLGMVAFLGGLWVRQLRHDLDHLKRQIDRVREDYQRRDDAEQHYNQMLEMLRDVKLHIQRIEDKLDRKADKESLL